MTFFRETELDLCKKFEEILIFRKKNQVKSPLYR